MYRRFGGNVTVIHRGPHTQRVGLGVTNIGNALYAEFTNVGFFRPEPGRSVFVTYDVSF